MLVENPLVNVSAWMPVEHGVYSHHLIRAMRDLQLQGSAGLKIN